jgi:hypothetical protein
VPTPPPWTRPTFVTVSDPAHVVTPMAGQTVTVSSGDVIPVPSGRLLISTQAPVRTITIT